ncbi:MAG: ABC transporter permease [Candidatus Doudnabacteria bacterium]|nr:ABC transporter permease [Candidatus Doudnabacteria bacterium]
MNTVLKQAYRGLRANPVRTLLTTLGIVIGIVTVIIVLSAGEGFRSFINYQIEQFGSNSIYVETRIPPTTKSRAAGGGGGNQANQAVQITTLKSKDVEDVRRLPGVLGAYGAVIGQKVVAYGQIQKNTFIFGSSADRFIIDKGKLSDGRPYTEQEELALAQVVVLGHDLAQDLFGNDNPVGKTVRIANLNFQVIGVYERRGSFGFSNDDQQAFIPLSTAQKKLLGIDHLLYMVAQAKDSDKTSPLVEDMRLLLRQNHGISDPAKDDFTVQNQAQSLETFNTILKGVTFLLIAVAAISLLVGGVGIMNIMYVVVTERIAEIGLKKAVGAKPKDILLEFLVEAILLTLAGGVLGILAGAGFAYVVSIAANAFGFPWAFAVPLSGILLGLGVAGGIGLVFGVFPARRASKLDPIEALRYE